ncbi:IclR family transcriptional regulator C-terminal domain-containing protein [Natrinema gelatinilyticum]|uniref:IclR family transcriptional regulator C-terminal domain-containing protein n=1 Tax=Natrinema gelatinilyticum TaxID=2961571 RepID=UPI0020C4095C|nr:IclR family transcriptional regulator C-terminal domain-containing protein [Natrinema gelatinilyticum]
MRYQDAVVQGLNPNATTCVGVKREIGKAGRDRGRNPLDEPPDVSGVRGFIQDRERGIAFNDEEDIDRVRAVTASIEDEHGRVDGSLSVCGPARPMRSDLYEEEIPDLLVEKTNDVWFNVAFIERQDLSCRRRRSHRWTAFSSIPDDS